MPRWERRLNPPQQDTMTATEIRAQQRKMDVAELEAEMAASGAGVTPIPGEEGLGMGGHRTPEGVQVPSVPMGTPPNLEPLMELNTDPASHGEPPGQPSEPQGESDEEDGAPSPRGRGRGRTSGD
jgi:hypothetical protein